MWEVGVGRRVMREGGGCGEEGDESGRWVWGGE